MDTDRGLRARFRYRTDEFLSSGAGKQLLLLFVLSMLVVLVHTMIARFLALPVGDTVADKFWFYFTRILDVGAMGGDQGWRVRAVSTLDTLLGVIVAGLLISSLAGNFQERLDAIKRGGSPVMEEHHFLILGWSEKIYSVIDQLSEANIDKGHIVVVVMAERDKIQMEEALRLKVVHQKRVKLVVRSGSSVSITDLARVSFSHAQGIVVLLDESDDADPNRGDGRIIKTLLALYNHPQRGNRMEAIHVTAEVSMAANRDIAEIASGGRAQVIKTNELIAKLILQTSRISGLSVVYDELLRFEGNEIHYSQFPQVVGKRFSEVVLDFSNGCPVGVGKTDGSSHILNPPGDHVIAADEELLILAEDDDIHYAPYSGPLQRDAVPTPAPVAERPVEHMLVLGFNEKIFPIIQEFENYVAPKSTITLVNAVPPEQQRQQLVAKCGKLTNTEVRHVVGEYTNRELMRKLQPQTYPTVMVLGDSSVTGNAEAADTRAIIALLLLRDFRQKGGGAAAHQKVCSEILEPRNRELAATTEIHDIVISNEMVSMVLAQITHEPRVRPVLEDLFQSEGSEIYLKDLALYAPLGKEVTFEYLMLAARARGEAAMGVQILVEDAKRRYGIELNPKNRRTPIVPKAGDRLVVLAENDG